MNYWVVGANWTGVDKTEEFTKQGYWTMGWADNDQPVFTERRNKIQPGDRIAIKQLLGQGQTEILVKALGIVESGSDENGNIKVDWVVTNMQKRVPIGGCIGTIYGPYNLDSPDREWINEVFRI